MPLISVEAHLEMSSSMRVAAEVSCEGHGQSLWVAPTVLAGVFALVHAPVLAAIAGSSAMAMAAWFAAGQATAPAPTAGTSDCIADAPAELSSPAANLVGRATDSPSGDNAPSTRLFNRAETEETSGFPVSKPEASDEPVFSTDDPELRARLQDSLEKAKEAGPIRIAIVGKRGVGKSTFVNSVRDLKPTDSGAAAVGADEIVTNTQRSSEGARYAHAGMILQDVPGAEGSEVNMLMGDEYIQKFKLDKADACILLYASVMEPRMLAFASQLEEKHTVPTFIVRNKVGQDCRNQVADGNAENLFVAFEAIKQRASQQIQSQADYAHFAAPERLFLIEAKYSDTIVKPPIHGFQKDFHRLKEALQHRIHNEAKRAQLRAIFEKDAEQLAHLRAEACRDLVPLLAGTAATTGAVPVPGVSEAATVGIVTMAIGLFLKQFGLTPELIGDNPEMREAALYLGAHLLARTGAICAVAVAADAASDALLAIPIAGLFISAAAGGVGGYFFMRGLCHNLINRLEKIAVDLYKMNINKEMQMSQFKAKVQELFNEEANPSA